MTVDMTDISVPCSKWHHSAQTSANHGQLTNPTATTTTPTAINTIILPSTTTTSRLQRTTNTENQNQLILTIQAPHQQRQQTVSQVYLTPNQNQSPTNLSHGEETITEVPETITIQLKPSQRLLVLTTSTDTSQPKIVHLQQQRETVQQTPKVQQQPTKQQRRTITLEQLQQIQQQRTRLTTAAAITTRSGNRIIRPAASIIRLPFLPGSPSTLPIVKQSSLIKKNSKLKTYPLKILGLPIGKRDTITQTQNLKVTQTTPVVNTTAEKDTVFYTTVLDTTTDQNQNSEIVILNSEESANTTLNNYTKLCVPPQQQQQLLHSSVQFSQSQTPNKTLATMAGIQLTGADEHVSPSSMSGATPTATVEEINVPVFIDEYLQQPAGTTTAATTNTTYSFSSSSSSNSQNCRQSNSSSGNGSNANNNNSNTINGNGFEDEEDFDFDMEMFAGSSDVQVFEDNNTMINNIIYNKNNNSNNNGTNIALTNNDTFDDSCFNNNNRNNIQIHNTNAIKNEISDDLSQQYRILWDQLNMEDWLSSQDFPTNMETGPDLPDISENAVNFNNISIKEFDDILINSQNPMLSCANMCSSYNNSNNNHSNSVSNSQQMQLELIANSEPFVPKIEDHDDIFCDNNDSIFVIAAPEPVERPTTTMAAASVTAAAPIIPPTTTAHNNRTRLQQKRLKLLLPSAPVADSLSTPTVLGGIVDLQDEKMSIESSTYLGHTIANIEESLKDETSRFTYTDEDSPSTPRSCYSSFTTCTNEYMSTNPYSPVPSNFSSTQQTQSNNTSKKRRGRPAKEHSDQPDPAKLKNMPDSDRKRLLDRAKNNEASRVSRRKNKEREEQEKETERRLIQRNLALRARRNDLVKLEKKFKRALMRGAIFAL
ncbi:putative uncharacterized protein DDB_G0282129 [Eurosta solidaginis]|uniref:putative uncharacterized protein DDB_G0282129 n=1 Tax=Eurosta solidaginis TaxID=178769 RepID=UPI00353125CF